MRLCGVSALQTARGGRNVGLYDTPSKGTQTKPPWAAPRGGPRVPGLGPLHQSPLQHHPVPAAKADSGEGPTCANARSSTALAGTCSAALARLLALATRRSCCSRIGLSSGCWPPLPPPCGLPHAHQHARPHLHPRPGGRCCCCGSGFKYAMAWCSVTQKGELPGDVLPGEMGAFWGCGQPCFAPRCSPSVRLGVVRCALPLVAVRRLEHTVHTAGAPAVVLQRYRVAGRSIVVQDAMCGQAAHLHARGFVALMETIKVGSAFRNGVFLVQDRAVPLQCRGGTPKAACLKWNKLRARRRRRAKVQVRSSTRIVGLWGQRRGQPRRHFKDCARSGWLGWPKTASLICWHGRSKSSPPPPFPLHSRSAPSATSPVSRNQDAQAVARTATTTPL